MHGELLMWVGNTHGPVAGAATKSGSQHWAPKRVKQQTGTQWHWVSAVRAPFWNSGHGPEVTDVRCLEAELLSTVWMCDFIGFPSPFHP